MPHCLHLAQNISGAFFNLGDKGAVREFGHRLAVLFGHGPHQRAAMRSVCVVIER